MNLMNFYYKFNKQISLMQFNGDEMFSFNILSCKFIFIILSPSH